MRVELYGLSFEAPSVAFYLWSPWRAASLETKLFEAIARLPGLRAETAADELRLDITDARICKQAIAAVSRVMKGWQEEAEPGNEKRSWRWLIEADTDADGYDHYGEKTCLWGFLRVSLDRGSPAEGEKGEDFDLDNFGLQILGDEE